MDNKKAVITTKYVANKQSVIVSVYHDLEDDWQFMGSEEVTEDDAMVLSMEQIIAIDPTITEILNIGIGYSAHRDSQTDQWRVQKDE
jgi:hypothetical protein